MKFDDLIRYKALHLKYVSSNSGLTDMLLESSSGSVDLPMKNVCAMLSQQLFDRLSDTCGLLDISKRTFIERALIDALDKADGIMDAEKLEEHLTSLSIDDKA